MRNRSRATARAILVAIGLALVATRPALAQESDILIYKVRQNDSLALLAAEFYGDRNKSIFIMVANKIEHPRALKPGERLRIPISRAYTTSPGDTFETIAANYLADPRRGTFLADFNGLPPDDSLASGTTLSIPFTITHTASAAESIASIAAAYFGDTKNATMIRRYNFLEKESIDKGEKLVVPVYNVRLSAAKLPALDADAKARRDRQKRAQARGAKVLPAAKQAWRTSDFTGVRDALAEVELDLDFLDTPTAVEIGVLLGAMHIAYDDTKPALEAFKRVLERKPSHSLSPYNFSPKILATWREAGGAVDGS